MAKPPAPKAAPSVEEKAAPIQNPWPPARLGNPADLPEGTGHAHSKPIDWPPADNGAKKPYKNIK